MAASILIEVYGICFVEKNKMETIGKTLNYILIIGGSIIVLMGILGGSPI